MLHLVVLRRRGAVGVDVVHVFRFHAGVFERAPHRARRAIAVHARGGDPEDAVVPSRPFAGTAVDACEERRAHSLHPPPRSNVEIRVELRLRPAHPEPREARKGAS